MSTLNIIYMDLAANCPDPVKILDVGNMTSHSRHTDRSNSTGGANTEVDINF